MSKLTLRIAPATRRLFDYRSLLAVERGVAWVSDSGRTYCFEIGRTVADVLEDFRSGELSETFELTELPARELSSVNYNPHGLM